MQILFRRIAPEASLPRRHTPQDAGLDVFTNEARVLEPGETHTFTTGISSEFPAGYVALIWDRSGLAARGIHTLAGVIDAGYRGEWKIVLHNASSTAVTIQKGDRIAQVLLQKAEQVDVKEAAELSASTRGASGFGSSGR